MRRYLGAGCDPKEFQSDKVYRNLLLDNFNCIYPRYGFKLSSCIKKDLSFHFTYRDAFLSSLPRDYSYRIHCLFWDYSLHPLNEVAPGERWRLIEEWLKRLFDTKNSNVVGVDVINEPLRLRDGGAVIEENTARLLGEDWMPKGIQLVKEINPRLPLFICQHQVGYKPVQDALRNLLGQFPGINLSLQVTASSFALNKFELLGKYLEDFDCKIQVPELTVWKYRVGDNSIPEKLRTLNYFKRKQEGGYINLIDLLKDKVELIGFWEPCSQKTFYYRDECPGFLSQPGEGYNKLKNKLKVLKNGVN